MSRRKVVASVVLSFLLGSSITYIGTQYITTNNVKEITNNDLNIPKDELQKLDQAYDLITDNYFKKVDPDQLVEGAIQGMLGTLKDPYTTYMDKEEADQFTQSLDSSFEGIGAEVGTQDGKIIIVSPIKDAPAEKTGLKPNDQILKIDGKSVEGLSQMEAVLKIRGKKGTDVTLTIKRPGVTEPIDFKITRDTIPLLTVFSEMKKEDGKDVGYIQITSFSENTAEEFKTQLAKLESQGIQGLLIDVRGNPGGYLEAVEQILDELVTNKKPYVQIEHRDGSRDKVASNNKEAKSYPIAVLTDKGSASASEILAAALKEGENYPTIGENSFGKGTVQRAAPMGDGSNIKLTISKWLTPNGNWIHEKGIEPTVKVSQPDYFFAAPINIEKPLKFDDTGEQVKNAQVILKGLGFKPGREDGYFSKETEKAVEAAQKAYNVPVTGEIDEKTVEVFQAKLIEVIKNPANDAQLQKGLEVLVQ